MGKPIVGGKRKRPGLGSDGSAAALRSKNAIEVGKATRRSRESEQMVTRALGTNTNLVSPPHACRKAGNDYGCTRGKRSAISFRRWRSTSGERPFAFSAKMRIPVRKPQIFMYATLPAGDRSARRMKMQQPRMHKSVAKRDRYVALARPAKTNNCQIKKSSRKGAET